MARSCDWGLATCGDDTGEGDDEVDGKVRRFDADGQITAGRGVDYGATTAADATECCGHASEVAECIRSRGGDVGVSAPNAGRALDGAGNVVSSSGCNSALGAAALNSYVHSWRSSSARWGKGSGMGVNGHLLLSEGDAFRASFLPLNVNRQPGSGTCVERHASL